MVIEDQGNAGVIEINSLGNGKAMSPHKIVSKCDLNISDFKVLFLISLALG
jgi:hypothetical protein